MTRIVAAVSALMLTAGSLAAQSHDEPSLVFSITGGLTTGAGLWTIGRQPQPVVGSSPPEYDTLTLSRRLRPGIVAGLAATYYQSPRFGISAEVTYFGLGSEQRCTVQGAYSPTDPEHINMQACDRANGAHAATSVVGFLVGGTYRLAPTGKFQPYVRGMAGLGLIGNSYIETSGVINSASCQTSDNFCNFSLLEDNKKSQGTFVSTIALGAVIWLAPAYRARFELRDVITSLPIATGPRDPHVALPVPPLGRIVRSLPSLIMGFDVVLEQRHTRRY